MIDLLAWNKTKSMCGKIKISVCSFFKQKPWWDVNWTFNMFTAAQFKASLLPQLFLSFGFIVSGLIVNVLELLTLVFIWPFNKHLFKKINHYLALLIWSNMTSMGQWWSPTTIELFIDPEDFKHLGHEHCMAVCNHKYDVDWLMGWVLCQRLGLLGGCKVFLKKTLKYIPVLGLSWSCTDHIFVDRKWESDQRSVVKTLKSVLDYPEDFKAPLCFVIYCEGTRFSKEKHEASMKVAREKGLPELKHHLLPRTKGFTLLSSQIASKVHYVYDINMGIQDIDGRKPSLTDVKNGVPLKIQILIRRIPMESIPYQDEAKCSEYVHELYRQKDKIFDVFATKGDFSSLGVPKVKLEKNGHDLYITIFWIIVVGLPTLYYLIMFLWFGSWFAKIAFLSFILLINIVVNRSMDMSNSKYASKFGLAEQAKAKRSS